MMFPKPAKRVRDPEYMAAVGELPCIGHTVEPNHRCGGWDHRLVEACHVGPHHGHKKADDNTTVPMCHGLHMAEENLAGPFRNWTKFQLQQWRERAIADTRAKVAQLREWAA